MKHVKSRRSLKKPLLIAGGVILVAAAVVVALELTNTTHLFHKPKVSAHETASQNTKGETGDSSTTTPSTSSQSTSDTGSTQSTTPTSPTGTQQKEGGSTSATLLMPSGTFVSNHRANLSSTESSVCTTTPGASCKIVFTNGSLTKELPTQATDAGGSTYWDWKLQDIGLTAGSWHVQAVATLNGQTKTADDATSLVVSQ